MAQRINLNPQRGAAPFHGPVQTMRRAASPGEVKLRQFVDGRLEALRTERWSWWNHWRELAEYMLPRRYDWLVTPNRLNRGAPMNQKIIDSTATLAWRSLASGLMAGITSPGRPWFRYTLADEDLAQWQPVKVWTEEVARRVRKVMAESNYYSAKATQFGDLALFGTAPMLIDEDFQDVIRCYNPCAGEYFCGNSGTLRIDTFYREFVRTAPQLRQRFKGPLPERVTALLPTGAATRQEFVVCQAIEPNDPVLGDLPGDVVPRRFPYRGAYWIKGAGVEEGFLELRGYHEWPVPTPRWDLAGNDAYGRSPAMDALGDVKQIQVEQKRKAQAIDKHVNPPLLADYQLKNEPAANLPGGITYVTALSANAGMRPVYNLEPDLNAMVADIQDARDRINSVFFKDLFLMISQLDTVRSATEIDARREEKLIQLGPMLERFDTESLDPDHTRILGIMGRARLLPPAPKEAHGQHIRIEYISQLSQMQQAASTAAIERLLQFVGNLNAVDPQAIDNIDVDETIDTYADMLGVPPKVIRATAKVVELRSAKAKAMAEQQQAALTPQAVQGAKVLSQTDLGGGQNALASIIGAGGTPSGSLQAAA